MKKVLAGIILSMVAVSTASALSFVNKEIPVQCVNSDELVIVLTQFEEKVMVRDLSVADERYSLWVNPETRSWTFVLTDAYTKEHCIVAFGLDLKFVGEW
jgi:hypothetical protein